MNWMRVNVACVAGLCVGVAGAMAQPLGTAFTYQGDLRSDGQPASGLHDLRFRLYDAATDGAQVGATLCVDNVSIADGRFAAVLDFGAVFAGQARYLEIEVRADTGLNCANPDGYVILGPRQTLTATPHAAYALSAGTAANATNATNAAQLNGQAAGFYLNASNLTGGTLPGARLGGTYSGVLTFDNAGNAFTGTFSGGGAGLTGLNAGNIASGTLSVARLPAGGAWALTSALSIDAGTVYIDPTGDRVGIGTTTPDSLSRLHVVHASTTGRAVYGYASSLAGSTIGVLGQSQGSAGIGVGGHATAVSGTTYGGYFLSDSGAGRGVYGLANSATGNTYGVFGQSQSNFGTGVHGYATSTSGLAFGVWGKTDSVSGYGVYGLASAASGLAHGAYGETMSTGGAGVYGIARATTGTTSGIHGNSASDSGRGVYGFATSSSGSTYGGRFESQSTQGVGVFGQALSTTGQNYGVRGQTLSTTGVGVYGHASSTTGNAFGGYFEMASGTGIALYAVSTAAGGMPYAIVGDVESGNGRAIYGQAYAASGLSYGVFGRSQSTSGRGVYGWASATTGVTYGVLGLSASTDASAYGVYATGRLGASGAKSFRIDHPADPENKYLLHYASESPEVINFYRGTAVLDERGEAEVEMPAYFARINREASYHLTPVGAPMPLLHVAAEIDEAALEAGALAGAGEPVATCRFRIAGGVAGGKVSWRVEAVRNDRWMRLRGAPVEVEKEGVERGKYQHPEFYGLPAERGMQPEERERPRRVPVEIPGMTPVAGGAR